MSDRSMRQIGADLRLTARTWREAPDVDQSPDAQMSFRLTLAETEALASLLLNETTTSGMGGAHD